METQKLELPTKQIVVACSQSTAEESFNICMVTG